MNKLSKLLISLLSFLVLISAPAFAVNMTASAHIENIGWMESTAGDHISIGTEGRCLRMEAFTLTTDDPNLQIYYQGHIENKGWQGAVTGGNIAGTTGQSLRIEAFRISLSGSSAPNYDIYYRAHVAEYGWLDWAKNGGSAGSSQQALRCEALDLALVPKGSTPPGEQGMPSIEATDRLKGNALYTVNMERRLKGQKYLTGMPYTADNIPPYTGSPSTPIDNNIPSFNDTEYTPVSFEAYNPWDNLGRCTYAVASIGRDLMPTTDRDESISSVTPSGWKQASYDFVDGKYLYNRCHLIGFQLTAEYANQNNLVTGTRYFNVEGMLPYENQVANYIKSTNNHVAYRVVPVFYGSNLVCSGVNIQAKSVEDNGSGISFNVFVYNVQPSVGINYANGESAAIQDLALPVPAPTPTPVPTPQPTPQPVQPQPQPTPQVQQYILNTNSHIFHYPSCPSVKRMSERNKQVFNGTRDQAIASGYRPCKNCNP